LVSRKTGGVLFHHRWFGNVDRFRRGFLPDDRLWLTHQGARQNLVHARDRNDIETALDAVVNLDQILGVLFRDEDGLDPAAMSSEELLLQAPDRQHSAAQRNLAGHRDITVHRDAGHYRYDRRHHGDTSRRAILRRCALVHGYVDITLVD